MLIFGFFFKLLGASKVKWMKKVVRYILKLYCHLKVILNNYDLLIFYESKHIVV
jgi:hypothetical protein